MVKLVYCVRRKEGLSEQEFRKLWKHQWASNMAMFAKRAGAVRWAQSTTLAVDANQALRRVNGFGAPFDGVAEVWWETGIFVDGKPPEQATAEFETLQVLGDTMVERAQSHCFFVEERTGATDGS